MKKNIKRFCLGLLSVLLLLFYSIDAYSASESQKKEFMNNHSEILKSIKEWSDSINKKGDIRIDFLEEVIHYNDIQICMTENIIKYTDNKEVRNFAKQLIRNSMECNAEINEILNNTNKNSSTNNELEEKYINEYIKLYNKMILNIECKHNDDSIEKIFITTSIKHHESLIDLTELFCKYGDDKNMIEIAKDIKSKNSKEIKKLKNISKKL